MAGVIYVHFQFRYKNHNTLSKQSVSQSINQSIEINL